MRSFVRFAVFAAACALALSPMAYAVSRFNQTLDGGSTVTVDNASSWSNSTVGALVLIADRSTQEDSPYNTPNYKGLFKTGDRICVTNNYLAWFDNSYGDGVTYPSPPYGNGWNRGGELTGWWSLNPDAQTFRYFRTGPNGYNNWAHNELVAGSDSPNQEKNWWDPHSPGIEHTIDVRPDGSSTRFNFSSPYVRLTPNSQYTQLLDGAVGPTGNVHYKCGYRMSSRNFNVDVTDDDDSDGISNYIYAEVEYVCRQSDIVCYWWYRPNNADVVSDLSDILLWACYSNDEDNTACDAGGPGEQWPNAFYGLYLYNQASSNLYQNFSPYTYGYPGDIVPLTVGVTCGGVNNVVITDPPFAIGHGTYWRVGEASDLSINSPRWQMTNLGVPGTGSGNSQSDPIQFAWKDLATWNEHGDGTIGFGLGHGPHYDPEDWFTLQSGKWYQATFSLKTNFTSHGDEAEMVSHTIPDTMNAGQQYNVSITVQNTGTATWSEASLYRLGTVGDSDPFYPTNRVLLGSGETVAPWQSKTFNFTMTAPTTPGTYTTDWQMVHDLVRWFGATLVKEVEVVGGQTPYDGVIAIPGTAQAENFDNGGEGVAYHDTSSGNYGGEYRSTDVDIQSTSDTGGGYNVGWIDTGEWLEYTVNVASSSNYDIKARVASPSTGGALRVEMNGQNVSGTMSVPNTGGWQTWTTVTASNKTLSAGQQIMRVYMESAPFNLNYIEIAAVGGTNNAQFISDTIPLNVVKSHQYDVNVTMKNTGTSTWTKATNYKLGGVGDSDPFAPARVELGDTDSIAPTQQKTFGIWFTAPSSTGTYTTDWRMLKEYVEWFGDTDARTVQVKDGVSINLGSSNINNNMTCPNVGDGHNTSTTKGGVVCRKNTDPNDDYYFYFCVSDSWAYQGSKPDVYIKINYYDTGGGTLELNYDSISGGAYKSGGSVSVGSTNTWKSYTWHITDAYFGNRENNGADFRIFLNTGITRWLDQAQVSTGSL